MQTAWAIYFLIICIAILANIHQKYQEAVLEEQYKQDVEIIASVEAQLIREGEV